MRPRRRREPQPGKAERHRHDATRKRSGQEPLMEAPAATAWLKVMTSARTQSDLFRTKHSLPTTTILDGVTVARSKAEMFSIEGKSLNPIAGLPARVPHGSFDALGTKIQSYVSCWVTNGSSYAASNEPDCDKQSLVDYVYDEYCSVVTKQGATCERVERADPGSHT